MLRNVLARNPTTTALVATGTVLIVFLEITGARLSW